MHEPFVSHLPLVQAVSKKVVIMKSQPLELLLVGSNPGRVTCLLYGIRQSA